MIFYQGAEGKMGTISKDSLSLYSMTVFHVEIGGSFSKYALFSWTLGVTSFIRGCFK